jgi:glucose dehydrogenase
MVGATEDRAPLGIAFKWGMPLVNGVAITAGGLVFTGAMDAYLRAFDAKSGEELWQGRLPAAPAAPAAEGRVRSHGLRATRDLPRRARSGVQMAH